MTRAPAGILPPSLRLVRRDFLIQQEVDILVQGSPNCLFSLDWRYISSQSLSEGLEWGPNIVTPVTDSIAGRACVVCGRCELDKARLDNG
jgi:hypothetical protein